MPSTYRMMSAPAASAILLLTLTARQASADTLVGCFSSSQPLSSQGTATYQSSLHCSTICVGQNQAVLGLSGGNECWCGNQLPPADSQVDTSKCNTPCQGYPAEECGGGSDYYTVWTTGTEQNVPNYGGGSSDSSSASSPSATDGSSSPTGNPSTTHASPSVVTTVKPGETIIVTQQPAYGTASASPTSTSKSSGGGGSNVAGIAAGVVVGVVAVAALAAGLFFFLRHKRRKAAEDEYKRSTQVSDFMRSGGERKAPPTGYSAGSDARLDPEAQNRRNSLGSIADDQDFSRRILRVANPT